MIEMKGLIKRLKKHGIKGIINILIGLILFRYYQAKCKILRVPIWKEPGDDDLKLVENDLRLLMVVNDLYLDINEFEEFKKEFVFGEDFYGGVGSILYNEKVLEHFIAYKLCIKNLDKSDIYIDVAACESPWAKLLREKGYNAYAIDLNRSLKYGNLDYYKVMDATKTEFKDKSISAISLQCAYEMFNGDDDIKLIYEIKRILKNGGRAIIVPLYLNTYYSGFSSAEYYFKKSFHDKDAKVYVRPEKAIRVKGIKMKGIPFARYYDLKRLKERVLSAIEKNNLKYNLYVLKNSKEIDPNIYCNFILEIIKEDR